MSNTVFFGDFSGYVGVIWVHFGLISGSAGVITSHFCVFEASTVDWFSLSLYLGLYIGAG